jgi:hypothetical protein
MGQPDHSASPSVGPPRSASGNSTQQQQRTGRAALAFHRRRTPTSRRSYDNGNCRHSSLNTCWRV